MNDSPTRSSPLQQGTGTRAPTGPSRVAAGRPSGSALAQVAAGSGQVARAANAIPKYRSVRDSGIDSGDRHINSVSSALLLGDETASSAASADSEPFFSAASAESERFYAGSADANRLSAAAYGNSERGRPGGLATALPGILFQLRDARALQRTRATNSVASSAPTICSVYPSSRTITKWSAQCFAGQRRRMRPNRTRVRPATQHATREQLEGSEDSEESEDSDSTSKVRKVILLFYIQ